MLVTEQVAAARLLHRLECHRLEVLQLTRYADTADNRLYPDVRRLQPRQIDHRSDADLRSAHYLVGRAFADIYESYLIPDLTQFEVPRAFLPCLRKIVLRNLEP